MRFLNRVALIFILSLAYPGCADEPFYPDPKPVDIEELSATGTTGGTGIDGTAEPEDIDDQSETKPAVEINAVAI